MHYYGARDEGPRLGRALHQYNRRMLAGKQETSDGLLLAVRGRRKRYLAAVAASDRSRVDPAGLWTLLAINAISDTSAEFRQAMEDQRSLMRWAVALVKDFGCGGDDIVRILEISDGLVDVNKKHSGLLELSRLAGGLGRGDVQLKYTFLGLERVVSMVEHFGGDDSALSMAARFVSLDARSRPLADGEDILSRYDNVERTVERVVRDSDGVAVGH